MHISYNGIQFDILQTHNWIIDLVRADGGEGPPLYYHWQMDFSCWLNPDVTARNKFQSRAIASCPNPRHLWELSPPNAAGGIDVPPTDRASPAITLIDVLKRLAEDRKQLLMWTDSKLNPLEPDPKEYILISPLIGAVTDCLEGPKCRLLGPIPQGNVSMVLHLRFETWTPLCREIGGPMLLSNRFTIKEEHDEQYRPIRTISGEAHFRKDLLIFNGMTPDLLREMYFPLCPVGWQRQVPMHVILLPPGNVVQYSVTDVKQFLNFPGGVRRHAAKIEVEHMQAYGRDWE